LWLEERCPRCGAAAGECCRPRAKRPAASSEPLLHVARGWRQRRCPACQAAAGEPCRSPGGRTASRPHSARLGPARRELAGAEAIWRALERIAASVAVVHLTAARGGRRAKVEVVATAVDGSELRRWRPGESELADALAAPVWARYGTFQRQPPITGALRYAVAERSITLAGRRGSRPFTTTIAAADRPAPQTIGDTSRDTSPGEVAARHSRVCQRCGQTIAHAARPEARYCSKRCRQAASRARLRERSGRSALTLPEHCAQCEGPMPSGLRLEARYCSKRCRQAASRARLALDPRRASRPPSDASRDTSPAPTR
jgi:hypothetical protein